MASEYTTPSGLILPKGEAAHTAPTEDDSAFRDFDPTPDERLKLMEIMTQIGSRYMGEPHNEVNRRKMAAEVKDRFASEVGVEAALNWVGVQTDDSLATSTALYYTPEVQIFGRLQAQITDHDLIKHQTAQGLADGQVFYVRADGTKHSEPLKKDFYG